MARSSSLALVACAAVVSISAFAFAGGKASPGTKGTCTAWEGKTALAVETCDEKDGDWDYVGCSRALHDRIPELLCKKHGPGKYKWGFQVADEKPPLIEEVTCK